MPPLKICANLTMMFKEAPSLAERYALAASAGFRAVEFAFPYDEDPEQLASAKAAAGVEQVLINAFPGETLGLAAVADGNAFLDSIRRSLKYCEKLNCKR